MKYIVLALTFLLVGCGLVPQPSPPKKPQIIFTRTEGVNFGITLNICYNYHTPVTNSQNRIYAVATSLNTAEKIADYKKQIELMVTQLDEASHRMKILELPEGSQDTNALIVVEFNGSNWLYVRYQNHTLSQDHNGNFTGTASVTLSTQKQVEEYKRQVKFLLQLIEQNPLPAISEIK